MINPAWFDNNKSWYYQEAKARKGNRGPACAIQSVSKKDMKHKNNQSLNF